MSQGAPSLIHASMLARVVSSKAGPSSGGGIRSSGSLVRIRRMISDADAFPGTNGVSPDLAGFNSALRARKLTLPACFTPPWQEVQCSFNTGCISVEKSTSALRDVLSNGNSGAPISNTIVMHLPKLSVGKFKRMEFGTFIVPASYENEVRLTSRRRKRTALFVAFYGAIGVWFSLSGGIGFVSPLVDQLAHLSGIDRFGDVVVHAFFQTLFAVATHGVGSDGYDGHAFVFRHFVV